MFWIAGCLIFYFLGLQTKAAETSFTLAPETGHLLGPFPLQIQTASLNKLYHLQIHILLVVYYHLGVYSVSNLLLKQDQNEDTIHSPVKEWTDLSMPRLHDSILTTSYSMYNTVHCIIHKEDEVSNEIGAKVGFHFSVLIVTCYTWPDEKVGSAMSNTRLLTVRNNSRQTFINLCQLTCYQSQNFSTMQALLWGLCNLLWHPCQQFDTNQFFSDVR